MWYADVSVSTSAVEPAEDPLPSAQHARLQAVLAQARAIRGLDNPQASVGTEPSPLSHAGKVPAAGKNQRPKATSLSQPAHMGSSRSIHDRTNKPRILTKASPKGTGSSISKSGTASTKPQTATTHLRQPQQPQISCQALEQELPQRDPVHVAQARDADTQPTQAIPLHMPAEFRRAMQAFR